MATAVGPYAAMLAASLPSLDLVEELPGWFTSPRTARLMFRPALEAPRSGAATARPARTAQIAAMATHTAITTDAGKRDLSIRRQSPLGADGRRRPEAVPDRDSE